MINRNKYCCILLFIISGCAVDLGYITVFRENLNLQNSIDNLQPFIDTNLSFVRATKGRNQAIFILSDYKDGVETWVGAENEIIITYKGLIIESSKLEHDVVLHNITAIKEKLLIGDFESHISFYNPKALYLPSNLSIQSDTKKDSFCNKNLIKYRLSVPMIYFNENILICFDDNKNIIKSSQKINPYGETIHLEYFYSYK